MYPSSEMLSEFKVSAINNNAELASSGDVTVTTKSGGERASRKRIRISSESRAGCDDLRAASEKQAKVWNTFGASLSGPVIIPKLYDGHNKTFFFVDYEGNRKPGSHLVDQQCPHGGHGRRQSE